jgi:hypothetical protein
VYLFVALLCFALYAQAASVAIQSPAADSALSGSMTFSVNASGVDTVEYLLNGHPIAPPLHAPYTLNWSTAWNWNGPQTVQAVGRDSYGVVVATAAPVPFTIRNGNTAIRMVSPAPGAVLSGTASLRVEISRGSEPVPVDGIMFLVDGQKIGIVFAAGPAAPYVANLSFDTTQFANGSHELFVGAHSTEAGKPIAMLQVPLQINNARAPSRLSTRWKDVFLLPTETTTLDPSLVYTNGETQSASATYASSDPSIAAVTSAGQVQGIRAGVTTITIQSGALRTTARVIVNSTRQFPHFADDGAVLTQYTPGRSLFTRSLFYLEPKLVDSIPGLAQQLKGARINALESGFYLARADLTQVSDLPTFKTVWDRYWNLIETAAKRLDFRLVLTGDNIARFPQNLSDVLSLPWSKDGLQHAFSRVRDSGIVTNIEMVDESSGMWGNTPKPSDGRWLRQTPPLADDSFTRLMGIINGVPNRPPLSWPVLWLTGTPAAAAWMGDPSMSDYASNYWDTNDWRAAYPWGLSLPQVREGLDNVVVARYPSMQRNRPALQLVSIAGPYYTKLGPGTEYTPGQDRLQSNGLRPESVAAQVIYAVVRGQAGVRAYSYDWPGWKDDRQNSPVGTGDRQTGSDPFAVGTDRWQAMSSAFHLVDQLEPYILQPQIHAVDLGPSIVTGARQGTPGTLLAAVNFSEATTPATVDLSFYRGSAQEMIRYRLRGTTLYSERLPAASTDSVSFLPGESILWVFPAAAGAPAIKMLSPVRESTVSGQVLIQGEWSASSSPVRSELEIDGSVVASNSGLTPFTWNTQSYKAGIWHAVSLRAFNASGEMAETRSAFFVGTGTAAPPSTTPKPPSASILTPSNGAQFIATGTFVVAAVGSDTDGVVTKLEIYQGASLIASQAASAASAPVTGLTPGTYSFTAKAYDNSGLTAVSAPVTITVAPALVVLPKPPSASILNPLNGAQFTAPGSFTVSATGSDTDGVVAKLEIYQGATLIASQNAPSASALVTGLAGTYSYTAKAYDNGGLTSVSSPVTVTVNAPVVAPPPPTETGTFVRGINLGSNTPVVMDGRRWLSQAEAQLNGLVTDGNPGSGTYSFAISPQADSNTLTMLQSALWVSKSPGQGFQLTQPIANGTYSVYLYAMENYRSNFRKIDVLLQGQKAATGIGELDLGTWVKYGPYPAQVTGGQLRIDVLNGGKGDPALFGMSIFTAGTVAPPPPIASVPNVSLQSPLNGSTYTAPASVTVSASASDQDGSISKIELYQGTNLIGSSLNSGTASATVALAAGNYSFTAKAYDNGGLTSVSSPSTVTVSAPAVAPPPTTETGTFVRGINLGSNSPAVVDGRRWSSQTEAELNGLVTDGNSGTGTYSFAISPAVDANTLAMLRSALWVSKAPGQGFQLTQPIANGSYSVYLYAMENYRSNFRKMDVLIQGQRVASGIGDLNVGAWAKNGPYPVQVTGGRLRIDILNGGKGDPALFGMSIFTAGTAAAPPPVASAPSVSLQSPVNGSSYTAPASVTVSASASDQDGSISKIELYQGTILIGTSLNSGTVSTTVVLAAGNYSFTAKAYDNSGLTSVSAPASVTVNPAASAPSAGETFVRGINLAGDPVRIEGNKWLSHSNAVVAGIQTTGGLGRAPTYTFVLAPGPDPDTLTMLQSAAWTSESSFIIKQPLPAGNYNVYLWLMENYRSNFRKINIRLQGQTAATGIGELQLGEWKKYGPYPVQVVNGELQLDVLNGGKGDPAIFGMAIFKRN